MSQQSLSVELSVVGAAMLVVSGAATLAASRYESVGLEIVPFFLLAATGGYMVTRGWLLHRKEQRMKNAGKA